MTERQKFIKPDELIVIHDSDYKTTRKAKINFQANYLHFKEEIKIMTMRNFKIYSRNFKTLIFVFLSPIILMLMLNFIQKLSVEYTTSQVLKNPKIVNISDIGLDCKNSKYFSHNLVQAKNRNQNLNKYEMTNDCISIGVAILGDKNEFEEEKINFIISDIANKTNLVIDKDIKKITKNLFRKDNNNNINQNKKTISNNVNTTNEEENTINTLENIYEFLDVNQGKIQYLLVFCLSEINFGTSILPCKPTFNNSFPNYNENNKTKAGHYLNDVPFENKFDFYTIIYNVTNTLNGFLDKFNTPLPTDHQIVKLKILVDDSLLGFYSMKSNSNKYSKKNLENVHQYIDKYHDQKVPGFKNVSTTNFPLPLSRFSKNADVIGLLGVFYLFFPSMIIFCILMIDIVKEKENNLKNYLHLNGLSVFSYWTSWIITALTASFLLAFEIEILGKFIFKYELFVNSNFLIGYCLFFFFTLTMSFLAFVIASMINSLRVATSVSYAVILIGFVNQCIFMNYGVTYFFFSINLHSIFLTIARFLLHFYPPFLFTKCYLDISRRATFHFESTSLTWIPGEYFSLNDIFTTLHGKLRIGVEYNIESFLESIMWFIAFIAISCITVSYNELRENMKSGERSGFFIFEFFKTIKTAINLFRLKNINIKREKLENEVNRVYEKFTRNRQSAEKGNKKKSNNNSLMKSIHAMDIEDCHKSVIREKLSTAKQSKKRSLPSGIRILSESKIYNKKHIALEDINLEINKGELITILGPNGAGKSTLINILIGQIGCSFGHAKIGPFIIHHELIVDSYYIKRLIGICSQFDSFWDELTVYETMYLFSRLRGIKEDRLKDYIDHKILEVNLVKKKFEKVGNLSGGMKRRLSICISMLGDPTVIFMDEPTSGLDPINRKKIWRLINSMKKNRVIILTTHLMEEADYLSDRIAVIINGKLRFIGTTTDMRELYIDGIILQIHVDITKLGDKKEFFDNDIMFLFFGSKIEMTKSGIYSIGISKSNKDHIIKAFDIFNLKSSNEKVTKLMEFIKESSISQANLETVFLELCKKYQS